MQSRTRVGAKTGAGISLLIFFVFLVSLTGRCKCKKSGNCGCNTEETESVTAEDGSGSTEEITDEPSGSAAGTAHPAEDASGQPEVENGETQQGTTAWLTIPVTPVEAPAAETAAPTETETDPATEPETPAPETTARPEPVTEAEPTTKAKAKAVDTGPLSFPIEYMDESVRISIEKLWYMDTWCYCARIQMKDYSRLKTALPYGRYGAKETLSKYTKENPCLLAINADYAAGRNEPLLRNGVLYGSDDFAVQCAWSQSNGNLKIGEPMVISNLIKDGYTDTLQFGADLLVEDGESVYWRKDGGKSCQRTLIGTDGTTGNVWLVVTEGRYSDGVSRGLQYYEGGDLLKSLGCTYGMALDGGGSSCMIWRGRRLTTSSERELPGILYVTNEP